jgi:type II secretory pathway component HofQ
MPEEGIETQELKEQLDEAREKAEEQRAPWLTWLSLSTAVLAVLAAIASLESGDHANEAIVLKTDATLTQSSADDAWAYFQSRSVKEEIYRALLPLAPRPDVAAEWTKRADEEGKEKQEQRAEAEKLGNEVKNADVESRHHLQLHHRFANSVTIFQVAIAMSAIAALTRKKALWWVSLGVGGLGAVFLALGFLSS